AGRVITLGPGDPDGQAAVCIRDGFIQAVVPAAEAGAWIGPETIIIDLPGRTLMPGFVDPHAHAEVAAKASYQMVDVRAPGCSNIAAVLQTLRDRVPQARDGWLVAQANLFFDQKLADRRFPTRDELDSVSTDIAIAVRAGGHLSILNSRALELSGIDESYEAVDYSITGKPSVQRDADGRATGIVSEMDKLLPFPALSTAQSREAIESGIRELFTAHGVTTIGEISESREGLKIYDDALAEGRMAARIHVYLWTPGTVSLDEACTHRSWTNFRSDESLLKIQGVKAFSDGGYSAARAALTRPYALEGHECGELALSTDQIIELARRTQAAGLQLAVHANGDRAQLEVCQALAQVADEHQSGGPRIRIEHAGNFVPDYPKLAAAWSAAGIVPVPQPVFIYNFGEFVPTYVGTYAQDRQFPFRTMLDDGWPISGSSDVWVGSETGQTNPFLSIASAVARRTFHGDALNPEQSVTTYEALRMHTLGGAHALGEEHTRG
ncbi:amidohydrolase, partial [Arthrobacter crystallopoietes]|uniref:amidohydrolase n=1 Tax=Crystallibacter crystallopoietes TaxID=37928 RepID=UPI0011115D5D